MGRRRRDAQTEIEAQKEIGAQTNAVKPQVNSSETGALMNEPEAEGTDERNLRHSIRWW